MAVTALIGLGLSALSTGMSFSQAAKQKDLARKRDFEAKKAMQKAKELLQVNAYKGIAIPKEAYEMTADILTSTAQLGLSAAQEGDARSLAATAGRIGAGQTRAAEQFRAGLSKDIFDLEKLVAAEDSRLRDIKVGIGLEEVAGAQKASRDAQEASQKALKEGFAGLTSTVAKGIDLIPLYKDTGTTTTDTTLTGDMFETETPSLNMFDKSTSGFDLENYGDTSFLDTPIPSYANQFALNRIAAASGDPFIKLKGADSLIPGVTFAPGKQKTPFAQTRVGQAIGTGLEGLSDFTGIGDAQPFNQSILGQFLQQQFGRRQGGSDVGNFLRTIF
jgi:hypothetical protein